MLASIQPAKMAEFWSFNDQLLEHSHSLGTRYPLQKDGTVWIEGEKLNGEVGNPTIEPQRVPWAWFKGKPKEHLP